MSMITLRGCERSGTHLLQGVLEPYVEVDATDRHSAAVPGDGFTVFITKHPLEWCWSVYRFMRDNGHVPLGFVRHLSHLDKGWDWFLRYERPLNSWCYHNHQWLNAGALHVPLRQLVAYPNDTTHYILFSAGIEPEINEQIVLPHYRLPYKDQPYTAEHATEWERAYSQSQRLLTLRDLNWSLARKLGYMDD